MSNKIILLLCKQNIIWNSCYKVRCSSSLWKTYHKNAQTFSQFQWLFSSRMTLIFPSKKSYVVTWNVVNCSLPQNERLGEDRCIGANNHKKCVCQWTESKKKKIQFHSVALFFVVNAEKWFSIDRKRNTCLPDRFIITQKMNVD